MWMVSHFVFELHDIFPGLNELLTDFRCAGSLFQAVNLARFHSSISFCRLTQPFRSSMWKVLSTNGTRITKYDPIGTSVRKQHFVNHASRELAHRQPDPEIAKMAVCLRV
jgi:hypothetical protein